MPIEVDGQEARVAETEQVVDVEVDTFGLELADVLVGGVGVAGLGQPQGSVRVTVDQIAQRRVAGVGALLDDVVGAEGADRVVDLDVVVVEGDGQTADALRGPHDTGGDGVGRLGIELRVTAPEGVVLVGRVGQRCCRTGRAAHRCWRTAAAVAVGLGPAQMSVEPPRPKPCGRKRSPEVGCADRAVVAAAEPPASR